jgi:hypothetical protein
MVKMRSKRTIALTIMTVILISLITSLREVRAYTTPNNPADPESLVQPMKANSTSLTILIFINSTIYSDIKDSLNQYIDDLRKSGFEEAIVLNWSDPNPLHVRETLQQFYFNSSLAGALLVGDLPSAEFEMFTEWDYERFPIDLYYMDLDGKWEDYDNDGIFDKHTGKKTDPEIWVGRIKPSNIGNDEISLINLYFKRNHAYRNDSLSLPRRALIYIDDDWVYSATMDQKSFGLLYDNITIVTDKATTNANDYKNRLQQGYEWVLLRSHGTWNRHRFKIPGGEGGKVYSTEYPEINPQVFFYELFLCAAARFTEPDYLAGSIVFENDYGLLAIGSTKLGGMLMHWTFYKAIAEGKTIGEAFKEWFIEWGDGNFVLSGTYIGKKWFYGLTIIGDPTLRLRQPGESEIAELQKQEEEAVRDVPYVKDLRDKVASLTKNQSLLRNYIDNLQGNYSVLENEYDSLRGQLMETRNYLYFFIFTTVILLAGNVFSRVKKLMLQEREPEY